MSSSRAPRVIVGATGTSLDETTLESLSGSSVRAWDPNMEAEYWRRVRDKAQAMAQEIVAKAKVEAEALRQQALQEGYHEGVRLAEEKYETIIADMSHGFAAALDHLDSHTDAVWRERRQDIVTLARLAVEKTLAVEMSGRREEILGALLDECLERVENLRQLVIRVHPEDQELMEELLKRAKSVHPSLERWRLKGNPDAARFSLLVETEQGVADGSVATRFQAVESILAQLTLDEAH